MFNCWQIADPFRSMSWSPNVPIPIPCMFTTITEPAIDPLFGLIDTNWGVIE